MGKKAKVSLWVTLTEKPAIDGLKRINNAFLDFAKRVDPATRLVGNGVELMTDAVRAAVTVVTMAASAFTSVSAQAIEFDTALRSVTTIADASTLPITKIRDLSYDLAAVYGGNVTDNARNLYEVIAAGVSDAATAQEVLRQANELSIGGLATIQSSVAGLTSVINAYGAANVSAERAANALTVAAADGQTRIEELAQSLGMVTPIASSVGISIEEVASAVAVLTANGIPTATAVEYVRSALANIIKPSRQAANTAKELGIAFNAQALASKGLSKFLEDVVIKSGASHYQLSRLIGDIGGFNAVVTLTKDGLVSYNASLERQAHNSSRAHDAFEIMSATLGHQVKVYESLTDAAKTAFGEWVTDSETVRGALAIVNEGLTSLVETLRSPEGKEQFDQYFRVLIDIVTIFNSVVITLIDSLDELHLWLRIAELPIDQFLGKTERVGETLGEIYDRLSFGTAESPLVNRMAELNGELERLIENRGKMAQQPLTGDDLGLGAGFGYEPKYKPFTLYGNDGNKPPKKETAAQRNARLKREADARQDALGLAPTAGEPQRGDGVLDFTNTPEAERLAGVVDVQAELDARNASIEAEREYRAQLIEIENNYLASMTEIDNQVAKQREIAATNAQGYIDDLSSGLEGFVDLLSGDVTPGAVEALTKIGDMVANAFVSMVVGIASGSQGVLEAIGGFVGGIITQLGVMLIQLGTAALLANALSVIPALAPLVGPPGVGVGVALAAIAGGAAMVAIGSAIGGATSPGAGASTAAAGAGRATSRPAGPSDNKIRSVAPFDPADDGARGYNGRSSSTSGGGANTYRTEVHLHYDRGMVIASSSADLGRQIENHLDASARLRGVTNPFRRAA